MNKKVALITVAFNQKEVTAQTIARIRQQTLVPDIIYVDNASTDGAAEFLKEKFPDLIVLKVKKNYGNSGGQYIACRYAIDEKKYEYIILSDNDALPVSVNMIEELVENASEDIVTQPWNIDEDSLAYNNFWPMHFGCYHRSIFNKIGYPLFEFFIYGDDLEFSYRMKKNGIAVRKMKSLAYSHPMKRSYLPARFYFNHRNYLNIIFSYNGYFSSLLRTFLFLNSLFVYKIIGETDYYLYGLQSIEKFLHKDNDNSFIVKSSTIFSPILSLETKRFQRENKKSFVNVHEKTNNFLKMVNFYGNVKSWKGLFRLLRSKKMISESIINSDILLYSFFFNKEIFFIDEINDLNVSYRHSIFPFFLKRIAAIVMYNISHVGIFLRVIFRALTFDRKAGACNFNEEYDNKDLNYFL